MFRILFVLIAAAVITFGTILVGNFLQRKVHLLDLHKEKTEAEEDISELLNPQVPANIYYQSNDVFGASIILRDCSGEEEAVLAANTLSQDYDTIMLDITTEDGMLLYTSPALCRANRMPAPETNAAFRLFSSTAAAVKAQNRNLCVLMQPNLSAETFQNAAWTDGILINELALYGVDEILIEIPESLLMNTVLSEALYDYIITCRVGSGNMCPIGILLSAEHYLDENSTPCIQQIADAASFLAIYFPTDGETKMGPAYRYTYDSITTLLGSFNVYNMRIILDGSMKMLAAKYEACKNSKLSNICFAANVLPTDLSNVFQPDDPEETIPFKEPADPADQTNPYATSKPKEDETKVPETQMPETELPSEASSYIPDETPWY